MRGATRSYVDVTSITNFNPHSPCGERPRSLPSTPARKKFQSTLPLRGATPASRRLRDMIEFQSTLPLRGATHLLPGQPRGKPISIHTPLAGSDHAGTARKGWALYFNPHSPCGERLAFCFNRPHSSIFQSTLPLRGATSRLLRSIRVPKYFNPHSPCGERPYHDADQAVG